MLRHAKAEDGQSDKERALSKRGRRAATRVGELLSDRLPDLILSSSSLRTRETVELFSKAACYFGPIEFIDALYLGEPAAYAKAARERGGSAKRLMLVGHNPGLEDFVTELTGERVTLATAALAECSVDLDSWSDFMLETEAELVGLSSPRDDD